jgi:hypothetical protein
MEVLRMKTRIIIEIETHFRPIYADKELEEDVTADFDREVHEVIDDEIRSFIEDSLQNNVFDHEFEYAVEEFDCFLDYGGADIKIVSEEIKDS